MVADYFFVRGEEQFLGKMGRMGKIMTIRNDKTDRTIRTIRKFVRDHLNRPKVLIVLTFLTSRTKLTPPPLHFPKILRTFVRFMCVRVRGACTNNKKNGHKICLPN